ncbi:restriction system protein [Albimonas donghaensis]|uniref:Restriction system protein n=1 Tax=Albimonas donghaensis TaxID=356660 RepID=A0A1H3FNW0_9RHOB|nr:restriction system protein [Albimonas donghaensis]
MIARRDGGSPGLRCKLRSGAAGAKAVQEAHAGKARYGVEAAGVLTNAPFPVRARDLAAATGIRLLSRHEIPELFDKVFGPA